MNRIWPVTSLLLLLLLFNDSSGRAQSATTFRVSGVVINGNDRSPVPHCHVVPDLIQRDTVHGLGAAPVDGVDTDEQGRFSIGLPSAGSWALRASAHGYRTQLFDQHEGYSSEIVLTPAAPSINLVFVITPDSTVSGVVLDEANEPVRHAQLALYPIHLLGLDGSQPSGGGSANAFTDDRGRYELVGLAPGEYRLSVLAQPWYAVAAQPRRFQSGASTTPLDPSLDVVYPLTWFPGGTDPQTAATIKLAGGETRQADFQLRPIPATHLRIMTAQSNEVPPTGVGTPVRFPQIAPVSPGGSSNSISMTANPQGQIDVGGLAPGWYRVQYPAEQGQPGRTSLVQVIPGSTRTIDMAGDASTATITVKIDGAGGGDDIAVSFVDVDHPENMFRTDSDGYRGGLQRRAPVSAQADRASSRTVELPPGRYLVDQFNGIPISRRATGNGRGVPARKQVNQAIPDTFVTGVTIAGNDIAGRMVSIPAGESSLTLHLGLGRASVGGFASFEGKPSIGALVLLVPVTVEQTGSITELRLDQTNTDGSFHIDGVIPGQYILVALDHGWHVNWRDSATLRHYLGHGIPLDIRSSARVIQNLEAQAP